ncbi:MAG: ABC transporter permease [Bradyrhizobiaceae bacterium]|nr:ABC transporter permease [Bradyrhizobiaceae bacterium]
MRREGSPFSGLGAVTTKELADHLSSARMRVLEWLIVLTAVAALIGTIQQVRDTVSEDPFVFLKLFTEARQPLPSFVSILAFLIPLMAIGLGFDAVNGEHNRRTLSRVLSQPIYRDALLMGKFLAGLITLAISLVVLWLLVIGLGLLLLGVPPSTEEVLRSFAFLVVALAYAGLWLAAAILFSIVFRSPATAALTTLGLWLFLTVLWPALSPGIAYAISPPHPLYQLLNQPDPDTLVWEQGLARLSPSTLFGEVLRAVLNPATRAIGPIFLEQLEGALIGSPLPLAQSLLIAWPQLVSLIAGTIVLFVVGYVVFQRQEVRA